MDWNKKYLLLIVALTCLALFFYGSYTKDNPYVKFLPTVGGLAFGLNTLIQIAQ